MFFNKKIIVYLLMSFFITSCTSCITLKSIKKSPELSSPPKIRVELFVMSQCPYGVEAEKETFFK